MNEYIFSNPNPDGTYVGDCVVRAIAIAQNTDWESVYIRMCTQGLVMHDMPSSNRVWGAYLKSLGYKKFVIPNECPDCYTVRDFCRDYNSGIYILCTGEHVVTVVDGNYYDTFDSGDEVVMYYWKEG